VADVARRHDVSRGLIYLWRRTALQQVQEAFVPAVIEDEPGTAPPAQPEAAIVLDLANGRRLRIFASAPPALAVAALKAMR
jgi:transposase